MDGIMGFITLFAGAFAPRNWAFCHGGMMRISTNPILFSILGNTYGGDGQTTFALPDLRGRAVIGAGRSISTYYDPGDHGGSEIIPQLLTKNIPAHTHPIQVTITPHAAGVANSQTPGDAVYATSINQQQLYNYSGDTNMATYKATITTSAIGSANPQSFRFLHPVLALNYIICLNGAFPPRS